MVIYNRPKGQRKEINMTRYEVIASKGSDVVYKKTSSPVEAVIIAWELKMQGYKTRTVTTEGA